MMLESRLVELEASSMPCWKFITITSKGNQVFNYYDMFSCLIFDSRCVRHLTDYVDSSGLEFFYRTTPPKHDATILEIGQSFLATGFFIPPGLTRATVMSYCSPECTKVVRRDGNIIASLYVYV